MGSKTEMNKAMFLEAQVTEIETHGLASKAKARITIELHSTDSENMASLRNMYANNKRVTVIVGEK